MRIFHIHADQFTELQALPDAQPAEGYFWVGIGREDFEQHIDLLQAALQRWAGGQLVDLHISDLLNDQLPSHFDYTSLYDLLVFRRLAPGGGVSRQHARITIGEQGATLEDLGSKNGTMLHGQAIDRCTPLEDGAVIVLGATALKFRVFRAAGSTETLAGRKTD